MNYTGEIYCQYINAYVGCGNRKCSECPNSKKKVDKSKTAFSQNRKG